MLDGRDPLPGRGWRNRLLDGRSVPEVIANGVTTYRSVMVKLPTPTAAVLAKFVLRSCKSRSAYVRDALRTYLIEHEDMDPDQWPT